MRDERGRGPGNGPQDTHRRRAEHFQLNITDDTLGNDEPDSLHSYSSPKTKEAMAASERRAQQEAEKNNRLRSHEKGRRNRRLFLAVWLSMVILLGVSLGQYLVVAIGDMLAYNKLHATVTVEIPKGASTKDVAQVLYENGVIEERGFFRLYSKLTKADNGFRHGTYEMDTDLDYEAIVNYLQSNTNRVDIVKVMFPEGLNVREVAELLEKNGVCAAEDVLKYANSQDFNNYDLIKAIPNDEERYYLLEGYLFPDTYDFYKDEDPASALGKMINNTRKKLTKQVRERAEAQGLSIDEVLNLASIIQAESADEADMYKVSSVLHNRLNNGVETGTQQLGCDATVFYPYRTKAQVPAELAATFTSRYNTYAITGLPPGPITNPGSAAIDAALNPANTDYYYFCHSADGKAYYAKTAAEHQKNLKKAGLVQ